MFSKNFFGKQGDVKTKCIGTRIISLLVSYKIIKMWEYYFNIKEYCLINTEKYYRKILHLVSTIIV